MADQEKEDIERAKQAISPAGLGDQSAEGNSGPGAEVDAPELPRNEREENYMNGDEPAEHIGMTHPNRSENSDNDGSGKHDFDKPLDN
ncbi:hypothetical protein J2I47_04475 [Fibrella sp. HMF5335]|uniref:Uncharacterized protein n=1 Tax=Fibrella rubiginis TaxID=2817060 RepID=A0A939K078_9BACT|nr:hypothetical protein [Fibrella rubiginis]MBO0935797.1 hypothetical protein [Fibrella rubiginis]